MAAKKNADAHTPAALTRFHWEPQPRAQALINDLIKNFMKHCRQAADLAARMKHDTGTRFNDWIDSIQVHRTPEVRQKLLDVGFTRKAVPGAPDCFVHDGALFPAVVLDRDKVMQVTIKVDSVVDFLAAWQITDEREIEGEPMAQFRRAMAFRDGDFELWVIERHGYRGFTEEPLDPDRTVKKLKHREAFRRRTRDWDDDELGFDHTFHLVDAAVRDLGPDETAAIFFEAERDYWQRRNRAAQVQKSRQDRLGLGWANHDHHTYRASREHFTRLIALFEKMGFNCRERFYAGNEAGWGAQVLEQPTTGLVIFADVDLSPDEIMGDFAHEPLSARKELGTVGLWCALHGEAILQAGMHHLECMFDFQSLVDQLEAANIKTMDPFTAFPFLRQAFTEGERWAVPDRRLTRLVEKGLITQQQAHWFRTQGGAIGSHLENLERNDGYKGFNQQGVSQIIAKTDPRKQAARHAELVGA